MPRSRSSVPRPRDAAGGALGVAAQPTFKRAERAFIRCNGLLAVRPRATLNCMRTFTAVIERDPDTGLFVGYVPGWPGAHSQGASVDELRENLEEVVAMLLEDGEPKLQGEFVGTQTVKVA
jgi:predicted RNase H-like HicB family nuclease